MYVANLKISGVRGFSGSRTVNLDFTRHENGSYAGWIVLAGRNGSGKSTILQAIALCLAAPALDSIVDEAAWGGLPGDQIPDAPQADESPFKIEVGFVADADFDFGRSWEESVLTVGWDSFGGPVRVWYSERPEQPPWEQRRPAGWFLAGYGPFRRLSTAELGRPERASGHQATALRTLFDEDAGLFESVSWLVTQHLYRLEKKGGAAQLLGTVITLLGDGLLPDGYQVCRVDSEGLWVRRSGVELPLRRMSDGYRTVTALVLDIVRQMHMAYGTLTVEVMDGHPTLPYPGVVLIDEVDAHLHVSWQQKIGEWLKIHFPKIQFIVTTHSPYICQSASPGGLIRLPGPDEQAPPAIVDDDLYRRIVYGSGDDAIVTELFGVDSPYSPYADELREDLGDLEIKVLDGSATPHEVAEYRRLSTELTSSPATRVQEISRALRSDS